MEKEFLEILRHFWLYFFEHSWFMDVHGIFFVLGGNFQLFFVGLGARGN